MKKKDYMHKKDFSKNGYYIRKHDGQLCICSWHFNNRSKEYLDKREKELEERFNCIASHGMCEECAKQFYFNN